MPTDDPSDARVLWYRADRPNPSPERLDSRVRVLRIGATVFVELAFSKRGTVEFDPILEFEPNEAYALANRLRSSDDELRARLGVDHAGRLADNLEFGARVAETGGAADGPRDDIVRSVDQSTGDRRADRDASDDLDRFDDADGSDEADESDGADGRGSAGSIGESVSLGRGSDDVDPSDARRGRSDLGPPGVRRVGASRRVGYVAPAAGGAVRTPIGSRLDTSSTRRGRQRTRRPVGSVGRNSNRERRENRGRPPRVGR